MKLEPLFSVLNNQLYIISDNSLAEIQKFDLISAPWSTIELQDECYNEEWLANLRDSLKNYELLNKFAIICPIVDKPLDSQECVELFINACNHTARRIKDCTSVAGFQLPIELLKSGLNESSSVQDFINVLSKKHGQYVYFAKYSDLEALSLLEEIKNTSIVII